MWYMKNTKLCGKGKNLRYTWSSATINVLIKQKIITLQWSVLLPCNASKRNSFIPYALLPLFVIFTKSLRDLDRCPSPLYVSAATNLHHMPAFILSTFNLILAHSISQLFFIHTHHTSEYFQNLSSHSITYLAVLPSIHPNHSAHPA